MKRLIVVAARALRRALVQSGIRAQGVSMVSPEIGGQGKRALAGSVMARHETLTPCAGVLE